MLQAWRKWREGAAMNVIDSSLKSGSSSEMIRCIQIALLCVQDYKANRPTMATVVLMLDSHSVILSVPSRPAFFMRSNNESDMSSSLEDNLRVTEYSRVRAENDPISRNEASITELYPR